MDVAFVDIHCHLLPGIDDGAKDWCESLAMARLAVEDGVSTIIATPHQLGSFGHNRGDVIRKLATELQKKLDDERVALRVLPGADVRIDAEMTARLASGDVLTLGDHRRHVLLELPHELYLPLQPILSELAQRKMAGILSHPERNEGILRQRDVLAPLVEAGCLLQITAGSVCGTFGPECRELAEWLLAEQMVHFVATDAHGPRLRRPLMRRAFERVVELADEATALELCSRNPARVAAGETVPAGRREAPRQKRGWLFRSSAA
jgi:protein-tyrosine phosphatase